MLYALTVAALTACNGPENVPEPGRDPLARLTLHGQGAQEVTAYAFRREGDQFLFDTVFREGWSSDGRLSVRMRSGSYKFLFASGGGGNLALRPDPPTHETTWEEVAFRLQENAEAPGSYLPADELFLQDPASDAETIFTVAGTTRTIRARLTRTVCRLAITLKRGYHDGTQYVEIPYTQPQSVLDQIARIDLTASGTGLYTRPSGSGGSAVVKTSFSAADFTALPETGFARTEGPYLLPPAEGGTIALDLSVVPVDGAALAPSELRLNAPAQRNKQLEVTLWITSGYPSVGIEIRTAPIEDEQTGDAGIWE